MSSEDSFSDRAELEEEHGIVPSSVVDQTPARPAANTTARAPAPPSAARAPTAASTSAARLSVDAANKPRHHFYLPHMPARTHAMTQQFATPTERFRAAAHKVMALRRTSTMMMSGGGAVGAEPGVDVRKETTAQLYAGVRARCAVEVVDYSPLRSTFVRMDNAQLALWAEDGVRSARPAWARVRWINVAGISYDIVSALALKYGLHPLALEDLLHQRPQARSKSDYYSKHMFLRVLCHSLGDPAEAEAPSVSDVSSAAPTWSSGATVTGLPRSASPSPLDGEKDEGPVPDKQRPEYNGTVDPYADAEAGEPAPLRRNTDASAPSTRTRKSAANAATLAQLKAADRVHVHLAPLSLFVFPDGTLLSFFPARDLALTAPIAARIRQRESQLRRTGDAALLLQSLLDLVVDRALEVTDEYHRRIQRLERIVLIKPKLTTVRALHVLSGDLILHKRTMGPIRTLVYGLRRYDADRCAAAMSLAPGERFSYISQRAGVYLADVQDHIEYALASLDMYAAMTENLIGFTFNMANYDMAIVMKTLTLVTVIFLPLTLLSGYFGMNFADANGPRMWSLRRSDAFYWYLAVPMLAVIIPLFLWNDLVRMVHYVKKRAMARQIKKDVVKGGQWRKARIA